MILRKPGPVIVTRNNTVCAPVMRSFMRMDIPFLIPDGFALGVALRQAMFPVFEFTSTYITRHRCMMGADIRQDLPGFSWNRVMRSGRLSRRMRLPGFSWLQPAYRHKQDPHQQQVFGTGYQGHENAVKQNGQR